MPSSPLKPVTIFYFAAGADDAEGKTVHHVLDRTTMWDCKGVPGCSSSYEFIGSAVNGLKMRTLPCPCEPCCARQYEMCTNGALVEPVSEFQMSAICTDSPEYLQLPLSQYTVRALRNFMRRHEKRVPGIISKHDLIALVLNQLPQYLHPVPNVD